MMCERHAKNTISRIPGIWTGSVSSAKSAIIVLLALFMAVNVVEMFFEKLSIFGIPAAYALENDYSIIRKWKRRSTFVVDSKCFKFKTEYFPFIPYSLFGTIKKSQKAANYLYWVHVAGENLCGDNLEIEIEFKHLRNVPPIEDDHKDNNPHKYTLAPYEKNFDKRVSPGFKFNTVDDFNGDLPVLWAVYHNPKEDPSKRTEIGRGKEKIEILSKKNFCWNLPTPEGKRVSKDFLLAALTAWTIHNNDAVTRRADLILKSVNIRQAPETFATEFIGESYRALFFGEQPRIGIYPTPERFPPDDQIPTNRKWSGTRLRAPAQILSSNWAKPIEAALLLRALTSGKKGLFDERDVEFALMAYPKDNGETGILLGWHIGFRWSNVVDMTRTDLAYEENLKIAKAKLKTLLDKNTDIVEALKEKGVYYSSASSIAAVDFSSAKENYGIQSLP